MSEKINIQPNEDPKEFYLRFKERLEEHHNFPEDYTFKFIIDNDSSKLTDMYRIFDDLRHTFSTKESKNGKYISCTFVAFVLSSDQVIELYKKVASVEGVVML